MRTIVHNIHQCLAVMAVFATGLLWIASIICFLVLGVEYCWKATELTNAAPELTFGIVCLLDMLFVIVVPLLWVRMTYLEMTQEAENQTDSI